MLPRRKELKRGQPLARKTELGHSATPARVPLMPKRRDTGPSRETRAFVFARDLGCCAGCGKWVRGGPYSVQHRVARGMGGTSRSDANALYALVLLCGSATTPGGCHLACEQRDAVMHERGLWLESWERPDLVPVAYATPSGLAQFWLTEDGARVTEPPSGVAA